MSENEIERKSLRFWSLDALWLIPWAFSLWGWAYLIERIREPLINPCRPFSQPALMMNNLILKCALIAAPVAFFFLRWLLMRSGMSSLWILIGWLGLIIAILSGLAHVCTRYVFRYSDESLEYRTQSECRNISTAILLFHKDTGEWPYYCSPFDDPDRKPCIDFLYGNMGDMPDLYEPAWETWGTVSDDMFFHLVQNGRDRPFYSPISTESTTGSAMRGWKEPYLPYVTDDPWRNKYFVSVGAFEGGRLKDSYVWCISAGPNMCLETPTTASETQGDDIGYRTK